MIEDSYPVLVRKHFSSELKLNDDAHNLEHCDVVLQRMCRINKHFNLNVNERVMVLAAYIHDLKCHISREQHHVLSAQWVKENIDKDIFLLDLSTIDFIDLYYSILEHRSSVGAELTSNLSVVLNTADKDEPILDKILYRALQYNDDPYKVYQHIKEKYSRDGYLKYTNWYVDYYGQDTINTLYNSIDILTVGYIEKLKNKYSN